MLFKEWKQLTAKTTNGFKGPVIKCLTALLMTAKESIRPKKKFL